jgi:hypothetical protein
VESIAYGWGKLGVLVTGTAWKQRDSKGLGKKKL